MSEVIKKQQTKKYKQTATFSICQTDMALWEVRKKEKNVPLLQITQLLFEP